MMCAYFDHLGKASVSNADMLKIVRGAAIALDLVERGFPTKRLGTYLLQLGGDMTVAVNGEKEKMIKKTV